MVATRRDPRACVAVDLALEAAGLGAWEIVPVTGESRWSPRAKVLLGFARADARVTASPFVKSRAVQGPIMNSMCHGGGS